MNKDLMFSSKTNEWATPQWLFDQLDGLYGFTLDPCASAENTKCTKYYTQEEDGLSKSWAWEIVFMNPPYGRKQKDWIKKAYEESHSCVVIALIPARTDTKAWHEYIFKNQGNGLLDGVSVQFLAGRLKFGDSKNAAPFPSALVKFDRRLL